MYDILDAKNDTAIKHTACYSHTIFHEGALSRTFQATVSLKENSCLHVSALLLDISTLIEKLNRNSNVKTKKQKYPPEKARPVSWHVIFRSTLLPHDHATACHFWPNPSPSAGEVIYEQPLMFVLP